MMRVPLITEMLAPLAAWAVVLGATLTRQPALLLLLPVVWFAPRLARAWLGAPLDERERATLERAEANSLRLLLVGAAALPWLLAMGGAPTLMRESADLGFLLLSLFVARALWLACATMPAGSAAQTAGALALLVAVTLMLGRTWPEATAPLAVLGLAAAPHLLARVWPGVAAAMWAAGALLVTVNALVAGFAPIEAVLSVALLAVPWAAAGVLAARAARPLAEA